MVGGGRWDKNSFMGRLVVEGSTFVFLIPSLFRIVTVKNFTISLVLGFTNPFSWNLNFYHNLSDFEMELSQLSPSGLNSRAWFLSSLG